MGRYTGSLLSCFDHHGGTATERGLQNREWIGADHKAQIRRMSKPCGSYALSHAAFAMPDGTANRIQRRKQTRYEGRSVITQVEMFDSPRHEPRLVQQFEHRLSRVIDNVARKIQAVPLHTE